jgi:hypothetical protein
MCLHAGVGGWLGVDLGVVVRAIDKTSVAFYGLGGLCAVLIVVIYILLGGQIKLTERLLEAEQKYQSGAKFMTRNDCTYGYTADGSVNKMDCVEKPYEIQPFCTSSAKPGEFLCILRWTK